MKKYLLVLTQENGAKEEIYGDDLEELAQTFAARPDCGGSLWNGRGGHLSREEEDEFLRIVDVIL